MLELKQTWTSTGSSGGLTAVEAPFGVSYTALFCQASTLASTQSFALQTAQRSTGPWFTEGSTSIAATANVSAQAVLRLTGPYLWVRPYLNSESTGTYTLTLVAVGE